MGCIACKNTALGRGYIHTCERATSDLGPLADPTPSERVLSLLRSACVIIDLTWPTQEDIAIAIVIAERKASEMAGEARRSLRPGDRIQADRCNDTAVASMWVSLSCAAKRRGDVMAEERYAKRADESLDWVMKHKGTSHGG